MKTVLPALCIACAVSRLAAADFTVMNTSNSGPGSLYQAITDANNTAGADRILFNIPGSGVHTIDVSQNLLPTVSESLVIDGYSQPGAKPNSLTVGENAVILIQVDGGTGSATANGLVFYGASADYDVRGLCLTGFGRADGMTTGVAITASEVHSAVVSGNFIGVLPDGKTPRGNYIGVGHVTQLGGTDPASRNVISGNNIGFAGEADPALGTTIYGAVVQGNYFGTSASGTKAIPNHEAIALETVRTGQCASADFDLSNTTIGGTASGAGNIISGNISAIDLGRFECPDPFLPASPVRANSVRIKGNLIGVQSDGISRLPNGSGIYVRAGSDNVIGGLEDGAGNVISFNDSGVTISGGAASKGNQILSNAIYANRVGIDLGDVSHDDRFGGDGPTPNDVGDSDEGPNNFQNHPVIQSTEMANGSVTIKGTLNSTANTQFTLQHFSESLDLMRPIQTYLGSSTATTDADGNAQFSATFALNNTNVSFNMTATSNDGNTSEFSQNAARLRNISTRAVVQGGDQAAIAGFIVRSAAIVGPIVIRALGPSLPGVDAPLPDPTLEIYDSKGNLLLGNDTWREDSGADIIEEVGLAPKNDLEAAVAISLFEEGSYTAVVRGAGNAIGVTLVEVYSLPGPYESVNISTRGLVGTGDNVMIAGTILEQDAGSSRIVARAIGPSLAAFGVSHPLPDPMLELHDNQGVMIASNDNWRDGQADALLGVDLAPTNDSEAAIIIRLQPGSYTAIVRGKGNATGVGLVELYNLH